jgi:gluconokinase
MPSVSLAKAASPLILALDLGTSSFRALLFDRNGQAVAGSEEQLLHTLRTTADGGAEADPDALVDLLIRCIDSCLERSAARVKDIAAVASSCFWHSLMGVDRDGRPVTPVLMWADRRSAHQANALEAELGPAVHDRVGAAFHSSYWPAKIRWLQETQPVAADRVAQWMGFAEYADLRLCGSSAASIAMASGSGMLDVRTIDWDPELLDALNVDRKNLPPLLDRNEPIPQLKDVFAQRWPALATIPWYPSIGDGACANVGSGAVTPERIALSLGTSGAMRAIVPSAAGAAFEIPRGMWGYRLDRGHMVVGGATSNGGILLNWLRDLVGVPLGSPVMADVDAMLPDSHHLTLLPFVAGERFPPHVDSATGVIAGMTLATTPAAVVRAGLESVAYRMGRIYERLVPLAAPGHTIAANGGAILSSPTLLQIVADTLGHELIALPPDEEASGRGAAILALHAAGHIPDLTAAPDPAAFTDIRVFAPDPINHRIYRAGLARQEGLERTLFPDGPFWDAV